MAAPQRAAVPAPSPVRPLPVSAPTPPAPPVPSIGRMVHYTTDSGLIRPGIIVAVDDDTIDLVVFNPLGSFPRRDVPRAETSTPSHWNWPPRV